MLRDGVLHLESDARSRMPAMEDPRGLRSSVIETWRGRMVNEWMSSFVFAQLADQMSEIGEAEGASYCREAAAEEREHGVLCGAVVMAAGGRAIADACFPSTLPRHLDTTRRAAVVRNVLSISCLSETVAVALIGAERLEMPDGPLRTLLTRIWSDEVGHARFGWTWLERVVPALSSREKASVIAYVPIALAHLEAHELVHLPASCEPPIDGRRFGVCSGQSARSLFYDTVNEVILPALNERGLEGSKAWNSRKHS